MTKFIQPLGARVLLEIEPPKENTQGGIVLTGETRRAMQDQLTKGTLRALGQVAFHDMCPEGDYPPIGSEVRYIKYAGIEIEHEGTFYRLLNDEDIYGYIRLEEKKEC